MQIDKAAFLALAGAIATTGACIVRSSGDDDGNTGGTSGSGASTSSSMGGSEGGTGGSGGGTCDDSQGTHTAADCDALATSCSEGVVFGDIALCQQSLDYFKPGVADDAVDCMLGLDATGTCQDVYDCRNDALAAACEEDVTSICADFQSNCSPSIDPVECEAFVQGLNATGRDAVITQCGPSIEGCLGGGVWLSLEECVNNLL